MTGDYLQEDRSLASEVPLAFQPKVEDTSRYLTYWGREMSDNERKLATLAGAVIFGSVFGVIASAQAKCELSQAADFKEKLQILTSSLSNGEIRPLVTGRDGKWTSGAADDLRVADWLQTWSKWSKDGG